MKKTEPDERELEDGSWIRSEAEEEEERLDPGAWAARPSGKRATSRTCLIALKRARVMRMTRARTQAITGRGQPGPARQRTKPHARAPDGLP